MSETSAVTGLRRYIRLGFVVLAIGLLPVLAVAGGKGIAAAVAVLGIVVGLTGLTKGRGARVAPSYAFWAVLAVALWALTTTLWSSYAGFAPDGNAMKLLAGVLIYSLAAGGVGQSARFSPMLLQLVALGALIVMVLLTCMDAATDYALTFLADPPNPGENVELKRGQAEMNVGHGVTVAALMLAAGGVAIWQILRRYGRLVAMVGVAELVAGFAIASLLASLWVGIVVLAAIAVVTALACLAPRMAVWTTGIVAAGSIAFAPLLARVSVGASNGFKAGLPFSWEHRVEGWGFIWGEIVKAPVFGHGFDASRVYDQTFVSRGFEMNYISLHPHNAGLHIWLETGAVGAVLASVAILVMTSTAAVWAKGSVERAVGAAGFIAAAACVSAISYGVWQEWWWASLFFCGALVPVLVNRGAKA